MAKNALAVGKKQFADVASVIKDTSKRTKLQNYIDEVIRCKTKILDEQQSIKALRESAVEDLNIEPKMFTNLVGLFFNNNFEQKREEIEMLDQAIHALMQTSPSLQHLNND